MHCSAAVSPLETFRIDQLVVGLFLSVHELGLYVAALAFSNLPRFIAWGSAKPRSRGSRRSTDRCRSAGHSGATRMFGTGVAFADLGCRSALLAQPLLALFFGAGFAGRRRMLQVLQVGTVLVCSRRVLGECLRAAGHPGAGSVAELWAYLALVPSLPIGALVAGASRNRLGTGSFVAGQPDRVARSRLRRGLLAGAPLGVDLRIVTRP